MEEDEIVVGNKYYLSKSMRPFDADTAEVCALDGRTTILKILKKATSGSYIALVLTGKQKGRKVMLGMRQIPNLRLYYEQERDKKSTTHRNNKKKR